MEFAKRFNGSEEVIISNGEGEFFGYRILGDGSKVIPIGIYDRCNGEKLKMEALKVQIEILQRRIKAQEEIIKAQKERLEIYSETYTK